MSITESCQKSKRKSVLAVGIGHVGTKFGWEDAESSQTGDKDEEGIKNHASDRRQKIQDLERPGQDEHYHGNSPGDWEEGALLSATTTAKSLLDNKVRKSGRLDGARLHSIPIDFTNLPAQVDLPKAGSTLEENGLMQTAHGLSDLEIGIKQTGNTQLKQNKKQRNQSEWVYAGPMGLKDGAKKKVDRRIRILLRSRCKGNVPRLFKHLHKAFLKFIFFCFINIAMIMSRCWWGLDSGVVLLFMVLNIHFKNGAENLVVLNSQRKADEEYDIINFWNFPENLRQEMNVGTYSPKAPQGQKLFLSEHKISHSVCSESCIPGFRKSPKEGLAACCYDCIHCPDNEISNETDRGQDLDMSAVLVEQLNNRDNVRFAFTLPSCNHEEPDKRYEWVVLPQGMANSPTMCQLYVDKAIARLRKRFPTLKCVHYMVDILLAAKDKNILEQAYVDLTVLLRMKGLVIAPEKLDYWSSALCFDVNLCIFFHRLVEEGSMMAALFLIPEDNLCDIGIIVINFYYTTGSLLLLPPALPYPNPPTTHPLSKEMFHVYLYGMLQ
ncbi:hypothetical protein STEG23_003999 [Scotinomys teguina]